MSLPQKFTPYQSLPENLVGVDYFVGDIHGAFEKFEDALGRSGFREDLDRIFSVGDLIDRGFGSPQALDWLAKPFFHAVRGNHEEMFLMWRAMKHNRAKQEHYENEHYFLPNNGGAWVEDCDEATLDALEMALSALPYVITTTRQGARVACVHASLPDGTDWATYQHQTPSRRDISDMLWNRNRAMYQLGDSEASPSWDEGEIEGLDAVVCGHVVVDQPLWAGRFCYIDTGGWHGRRSFTIASIDQIVRFAKKQRSGI